VRVQDTNVFVAEFERENLEFRAGVKKENMLHDRLPHETAHAVA
jgi:hypothetical protein